MIFLQILLWVVLAPVLIIVGVLLIALLISLLPLKITAVYQNEELKLWFRCLFYKKQIDITSTKPKKEPKKKVEVAKEAKPKEKTKSKKLDNRIINIKADKIQGILGTTTGTIRRIFKKLKIQDVWVQMAVYDPDAAKTAENYGKVNAFFYTVVAGLENLLNLQFEKVDIKPDFNNDYPNYTKLAGTIKGNIFNILVALIWALRKLYKEKVLFPKGLPFFRKKRRRKRKRKNIKIKCKNGGKNK